MMGCNGTMEPLINRHELLVFEAINDYLKQNRTFSIVKIINYLNSRFSKGSININTNGIREILISLLEKKMVVEGAKLTKKDVLKFSRRKKIYDYIKENPGTYINKMAKDLKIRNVVVYYHLSMLLKFNFIKKTSIDNHVVYFDSNIDLRDINKLYLTSKEKSKKIINYLKINNFGISKTKLSRDLKFNIYTIEKYINSLEQFNIISKEKISNQILYFLEDK